MTASVSLLPPGATATALTLPEGLGYEEWAQLGHALGRMGRAVQWWIGDWLVYGEHRYGEKFAQAAAEIGLHEQTLLNYQWVARSLQTSRRREVLSWGHHEAVAGLPPEVADELLLRAEVEGWARADLRQRVRGGKNGSTPEVEVGDGGTTQPGVGGTPEVEVGEVEPSRLGVHFSSATDEWATPQDLFDVLDKEFQFDLDVCASPSNAKVLEFFARDEDGLSQEWDGVCWMNPPYGDEIGDWVKKAYESGKAGATVVCLVPARVDTNWWWDYCRHGEIRFLRWPLAVGGSEPGALSPSAVVIFPCRKLTVLPEAWWDWKGA